MKGTEAFKDAIERYVTGMADSDAAFAEKAVNPAKNIDDCVAFILNEVQKSGINGFTDEEIYSIAVHYYVEDNVSVGTMPQCQVIVNHQVQLTDEEIEELRKKAREKVFSEEASRIRSVGKSVQQKSTSAEETGQLFSFD
ncbi:MAG: PcfK-like family protein [Candidatus Methanomethylophilaceae archaeon]|nr:PcfK-like family protein [Candidatus Methanomethylophilaceae archaeon]